MTNIGGLTQIAFTIRQRSFLIHKEWIALLRPRLSLFKKTSDNSIQFKIFLHVCVINLAGKIHCLFSRFNKCGQTKFP